MIKIAGLLVLPFLSLWGGGVSHPVWAGLFIALNGLWATSMGFPAKVVRGMFLWWGVLIWGILTFWAGFLGGFSSWILSLRAEGIVTAGLAWSPQPWVSLESLLLLATGLLWFHWLLANPVGERMRVMVMRVWGMLTAGLGILALIVS